MKRRNFLRNASVFTGSSMLLNSSLSGKAKLIAASDKGAEPDNGDSPDMVGIAVTAPSSVGINEPFWLGIRLLTTPFYAEWVPQWQRRQVTVDGPFNQSSRGIRYMENVLPAYTGSVEISGDEGYRGPGAYSFAEGAGPYERDKRPVRRLDGFSFTTPGVKYIRVKDPLSGMEGISNPIYVEAEPQERLFWGNLHCHSFFGDGIRTPEEIHAFAKDESFLDVFALTDHTEAISDAQWNYFREVSNTFNEPERFVSFLGGEWTSAEFGHHGFIYPGNEGPIIRSNDPDQNTLEKLYAIARSHKALVIANHTAEEGWGFDWDKGHDPQVERLVEIYSIGGVYEIPAGPGNAFASRQIKKPGTGNYVVDGLKKGRRLGMIGVGDDHDGRPGDALHALQKKPESYRDLLGPGLMGVWAKELTRQSVFDALWNRRVFGTTNNRTWLKFAINDHPMGSEMKTDGELKISVEVASNLTIQRIDLIKEGETVQFVEPGELEASWDLVEKESSAGTWYYVRVTMSDEHLAWSSPIWING